MSNIILKDNNGTVLYPKTSASMVEGLDNYIYDYLNPTPDIYDIVEFLNSEMAESEMSVYVRDYDETGVRGERSIVFTFPPFSKKALNALRMINKHHVELVLFRHNLRLHGNRTSTYSDHTHGNYREMEIAYDNGSYADGYDSGRFHTGLATVLGTDMFSRSVSLEELKDGMIERNLRFNASGEERSYDFHYEAHSMTNAGVKMAPADITNKSIKKQCLANYGSYFAGIPGGDYYESQMNPACGFPIFSWPEYGQESYPDGWRTGFRIGFIFHEDLAHMSSPYDTDYLYTVPFSMNTYTDRTIEEERS